VLCLRLGGPGAAQVRMVTHNDVSEADIDHALPIIKEVTEHLA